MDDARSEHPDEGTIHAWLDGALDDATSQALAAHVAACRECAERVAEARGLIAGASRVVSALDDAPSTAGPAWGRQTPPAGPAAAKTGAGSAWRMLRVTPTRAAIAATVLVALGVSLTYRRAALDTEATRAMLGDAATSMSAAREERAGGGTGAGAAAAPMAPPRDALLDSAVARNLAVAQPKRVLKAAAGVDVPVPEVGRAGTAPVADIAAPTRVAAGRAAMQAQRESTAGIAPDQVMAGRVYSRVAAEPTASAAQRADSIASPPAGVAAVSAPVRATVQLRGMSSGGPMCYRVESASGAAATWGTVALPLVVAVDAGAQSARVLTPAGQPTDANAVVTRAGEDSLLLRLRRIGYEGTLALGAPGDARAGVMRSRPIPTTLGEMVTTGVAEAPASAPTARRARPAAKVDAAAASAAQSAVSAAPAVAVVARLVACP